MASMIVFLMSMRTELTDAMPDKCGYFTPLWALWPRQYFELVALHAKLFPKSRARELFWTSYAASIVTITVSFIALLVEDLLP